MGRSGLGVLPCGLDVVFLGPCLPVGPTRGEPALGCCPVVQTRKQAFEALARTIQEVAEIVTG